MASRTDCKAEIKVLLESGHETEIRDRLTGLALAKRECFKALMDFFLNREIHWRYNQRASWSASLLAEKKPAWMLPYIDDMLDAAIEARHVAVRRNVVRLLQFMEIPEEYAGKVYDMCFGFLNDASQTVAVRVFSMSVLANIALSYPEMIPELKACIESHYETGTAGYKSRARKILKMFNKH